MLKLQSQEEILKGLNECRITDKVYSQYTQNTRDNEYLSKDEVVRKLYRNMLLSIKSKYRNKDSDSKYMYYYGSMQIVAYGWNIVYINNNCKVAKGWYKDEEAYDKLNEILGINY